MADGGVTSIRTVRIPDIRPLRTVPDGEPEEFSKILDMLAAIPAGESAYVRLNVLVKDTLPSDCEARAADILKSTGAKYCCMKVTRPETKSGAAEYDTFTVQEMRETDPLEVARMYYRLTQGKEMDEKYVAMLAEYDLPPVMAGIIEKVVRQLLNEGNKEIQDTMTLFKRQLSEVERQIHDTKVRYGTGKIDDDIFSVAIQELEDRKGKILLELEKFRNTLSNTESEVSEIVATCCKLGSLWLNADLGTKVKLQNLVFPYGVFWNHEKACYRTPERGVVFEIIDLVSGRYKKETEADDSVSVSVST